MYTIFAIRKMAVNELRDFMFQNYSKETGFESLRKRFVIACKQINRKNN